MPHLTGKVLEAGAGIGTMTTWLNIDAKHEWILLEPDSSMARVLQEKIQMSDLYNNCTVVNDTIDGVAQNQFDTILYIDVLEHIKEDSAELQKAAKLLRAGGKLIVLSPAFQFLYSGFDEAVGHFRRYSKHSLKNIQVDNLRLESLEYLDTMGFICSLMNKGMLKQDYPTKNQIRFWDRILIPLSIIFDRLAAYSFGKSILAVWKK